MTRASQTCAERRARTACAINLRLPRSVEISYFAALFLVRDVWRLDRGEKPVQFRLARVANGDHRQDRFAGGKRDARFVFGALLVAALVYQDHLGGAQVFSDM